MNEPINQGHPLLIGKFFSSEARYKHDEVGNHVQYIEKHLAPLISSGYEYARAAGRLILQGCAACSAKGG